MFQEIEKRTKNERFHIWFHCVSSGELLAVLPIIRFLQKTFPKEKIIVTHFSPSGFTFPQKGVFQTYLPYDTKKNISKFISLVEPKIFVVSKWDFWQNALIVSGEKNIPRVLLNVDYSTKKKLSWFSKRNLQLFDVVFTVSKKSQHFLHSYGVSSEVIGDFRYNMTLSVKKNHFSRRYCVRICRKQRNFCLWEYIFSRRCNYFAFHKKIQVYCCTT